MHNFFKKYFFINEFEPNLIKNQDKNTTIIYRNYDEKIDLNKILKIKNFCKKNNIKFFLSNNIKLAVRLDLDGAYIPSFNKNFNHLTYSYKKKFSIIGSAHNLKEIRIKERQQVSKIILSSIFKKNKNYLGLNKFNNFSKLSKKRMVALGGIDNNNFRKINLLNISGFAGISFFKKKAPM
ncbi:thiamine phosphate synthase [Candidatus Pelagibacter sp. HIMB1493]|uniref:thiamine phosphate synthase n=1 Tax=Candidatus Pelagibacter sp. HIMB1493 TaxID=3413334 RepID=UPI003F861604